ncbi:MAG TPA: hypothetical protein VK085_12340 [Pseudogracilibacillus sp.]|nr:hypothetical protein [Pseudogracilibacillus sp.]
MPKQLKGGLYYLFANVRYSLTVFWTILLVILLVTIVLTWLLPDSVVSFQLAVPVYVFAAVIGYSIVKNAFPYLIKMGSTRINLVLSFGIYGFLLAFLNAILANTINNFVTLLIGTERNTGALTVTENGSTMTFNHVGEFLGENTWIMRVFIDTSISFFLLAVMFIIGLIFYRYGLIGGFSFLGVVAITIVFGFSKGWLLDFFIAIFENFSFAFFYQLFAVGIIIYLFSFFLLRRLTV